TVCRSWPALRPAPRGEGLRRVRSVLPRDLPRKTGKPLKRDSHCRDTHGHRLVHAHDGARSYRAYTVGGAQRNSETRHVEAFIASAPNRVAADDARLHWPDRGQGALEDAPATRSASARGPARFPPTSR